MSFLELAWDILPSLLKATTVTLELTGISIAIGLILGILLALGRLYGNKPIYAIATTYVEFIRGTPLLVQLFIFYFGLPSIGINISPFFSALAAFSLNSGAYQAEYFRGAIQSIKGGQMLAARSIGMSRFKGIVFIVIPQALRLVIPSWSNELIYLVKYSSLAYMVQVPELMARGKIIASRNFRTFEVFLVVAFIYLVVVLILSKVLDLVEEKVKIPGLGT